MATIYAAPNTTVHWRVGGAATGLAGTAEVTVFRLTDYTIYRAPTTTGITEFPRPGTYAITIAGVPSGEYSVVFDDKNGGEAWTDLLVSALNSTDAVPSGNIAGGTTTNNNTILYEPGGTYPLGAVTPITCVGYFAKGLTTMGVSVYNAATGALQGSRITTGITELAITDNAVYTKLDLTLPSTEGRWLIVFDDGQTPTAYSDPFEVFTTNIGVGGVPFTIDFDASDVVTGLWNYPADSAAVSGTVGSLLLKLRSTPIEVHSPFTQDHRLEIVQGDDYAAADGTAIDIPEDPDNPAPWPNLTGATLELTASTLPTTVTLTPTVLVPTSPGKTIRLQIAAAAFASSRPYGNIPYSIVATLANAHTATLVRGTIQLLPAVT